MKSGHLGFPLSLVIFCSQNRNVQGTPQYARRAGSMRDYGRHGGADSTVAEIYNAGMSQAAGGQQPNIEALEAKVRGLVTAVHEHIQDG